MHGNLGRQAEKGMSWPSAGSRVFLMGVASAELSGDRNLLCGCNQGNFQLPSSFYLSKKKAPYLRELPVTGGVFCGLVPRGNLIFEGCSDVAFKFHTSYLPLVQGLDFY
jgi:hypothetical protein